MTERATRLALDLMLPNFKLWRHRMRVGEARETEVYDLLRGTPEEGNLSGSDALWLLIAARDSRSTDRFREVINDYIADMYGGQPEDPLPSDDPGA